MLKNKNAKLNNKCKIDGICVIYLIIIFSFLNATLRFNEHGMFSLYRIFSLPVFLIVFLKEWEKNKKGFMFFLICLIYSILVSLLFYQHIQYNMYVFLFYNFVQFILLYCVYCKRGLDRLWKFLNTITVMTLLLCFLQYIFRFRFPYVYLSTYPCINVYFSNENELAEALACMAVIYAYQCIYLKNKKSGIKLILIAFIVYFNDAKLSAVGLVVAIVISLWFKFFPKSKRKMRLSGITVGLVSALIFFSIIIVLFSINIKLKFPQYTISIRNLIGDSIVAILKGEPMNMPGSIGDRTDAIIYGIKELKSTFLCGIGFGNSIYMLSWLKYSLKTAMSMHNLAAQLLCEFGWLAILVYGKILKRMVYSMKRIYQDDRNVLLVVYPIGFLFISSQSSSGIFSNYLTWAVTIYIFLLAKEMKENGKGCTNSVRTIKQKE